jgi:predicted DNA-binding transcriptional regulator YafY
MPEKISPYASPSVKVLSLHGLLLFSGKQYSLTQLSQLLRCSKQTVLRMMDQIELSHQAKVESWMEGGRKWYKVKTPPVRPRVCLDAEAIQHLLVCRDFVWHLLPQSLREEISRTIAHTTVLLPDMEDRSRAMTKLGEAYSKGLINYTEHQHLLDVLLSAMVDHRVCRVRYQSPKRSEPKEYCIAPLTMVAYHATLYIRCWLVTDAGEPEIIYDGMLLAIQRLLHVELTERTFTVSKDSLRDELHIFGLMKGEPFRVQIIFRPEAAVYVKERKWSEDQTISPLPDGGIILEFTATSRPEVVSWVLSFGPDASVLAPEDLRDEIKGAVGEMMNNYK